MRAETIVLINQINRTSKATKMANSSLVLSAAVALCLLATLVQADQMAKSRRSLEPSLSRQASRPGFQSRSGTASSSSQADKRKSPKGDSGDDDNDEDASRKRSLASVEDAVMEALVRKVSKKVVEELSPELKGLLESASTKVVDEVGDLAGSVQRTGNSRNRIKTGSRGNVERPESSQNNGNTEETKKSSPITSQSSKTEGTGSSDTVGNSQDSKSDDLSSETDPKCKDMIRELVKRLKQSRSDQNVERDLTDDLGSLLEQLLKGSR